MSEKNAKVICHISTGHTPFDVRIYYRECCSLAKAGYTVYLIAPSEKADGANGVNIIPIKKVKNRFLRMLFMPWIAMATALKTQAYLYHYHDPELLPMGFVMRWLLGKKVVYDIHESVPHQIMSKLYLPGFSRKFVSVCYKLSERIFLAGQSPVIANKNCMEDYPGNSYLVQNYPLLDSDTKAIRKKGSRKSRTSASCVFRGSS